MRIGSLNTNGKTFDVWMNPDEHDFSQIGEVVRFTADITTHSLYVWNFSAGHHADVSVGMRLGDSAGSTLPEGSGNENRGWSIRDVWIGLFTVLRGANDPG